MGHCGKNVLNMRPRKKMLMICTQNFELGYSFPFHHNETSNVKYKEGVKGDKTGGRNFLGVCGRTQRDDLE